MTRLLLLLAILAGVTSSAVAHEVRPAFLQIREIEADIYDILWKTPAQGEMRLALNVVLPPECETLGPLRSVPVQAAFIQQWQSNCAGGLTGKEIAIENLDTSLTDVILLFEPLSASPKTLRISGASPHITIPARASLWNTAGTYFRLGVEHILFGFDHLLFVLCLIILVGDPKRLLGAGTAFTVAHSITLAATTFGWVHLASAPVEASIALSIAFIAVEIMRSREGKSSMTYRWPWIASFGFGLLHGFGFAAALREIGLPEGAVPFALLFFNVGVEAGQILFIGAVMASVFLVRRLIPTHSIWFWKAPTYFAGIMACYWFIERTASIIL